MKWDRFFEGAMFILFPNVPGATFIQEATLIPETRVLNIAIVKIELIVDYTALCTVGFHA